MDPVLRPMAEADVLAAERVNRLAFGTFFGLPDPMQFRGDSGVIAGRLADDPAGAFVVELEGAVVASGQLMNWGSVIILGPLTVHPDYQSRGIARMLMDALVAEVDRRGPDFCGLFTHPQSPLHIRLYEEYGFWMERITGVMAKPVSGPGPAAGAVLLSALAGGAREAAIGGCRTVAESVHPGLDLSVEIRAVLDRGLGDVVAVEDDAGVAGFAICHHGTGTEAGSGELRVKFAAARSGEGAADHFRRLVAACGELAASRGAPRIAAGCSSGRGGAYRILQELGFRTFMNGVAMLRPAEGGYNRSDRYVIDDWR